jgi:gliding motility-associated-like protein
MLSASATGAATYSWITSGGTFLTSTSQPTVNIQGGGTYSVIAIASNSCAAAAAVANIANDSGLPVVSSNNNSPSVTCTSGLPANSVTLSVTNGSVQTYAWNPASGVSSPASNAVSFTAPGTYTCLLTAPNTCTNTFIISVGNATNTPPGFAAGTGTAAALNCTNTQVTIAPTFTSSSSSLTYTWTGGGIIGSANNSSVTVGSAGVYTVNVTDLVTGCTNTAALSVPVTGSTVTPTASIIASSSIGISCQPNSSTVALSASGSPGLTYTWSTGETTSAITATAAGVYTLSFTDPSSGCSSFATTTVQNNSNAPSFNASSSGNLPCGPNSTTSLSATSSNTNVTYTWSGASIISGSNTASPVVGAAGVYTVTCLDPVTGCSASSTLSISQTTVSAGAAASATTGPAPLAVDFSNSSSGASTYTWTFGDGNSSNQTTPSNSYGAAGTYTVILYSANGNCQATDTLIINVLQGLGDIPEVFTPNGDPYNQQFEIKGLDSYPNNSLQVFNRWGNPVYFAKPYKNDWQGIPNVAGKTGSDKLPTGTYYYILDLGDEKIKEVYRGYIQIQY